MNASLGWSAYSWIHGIRVLLSLERASNHPLVAVAATTVVAVMVRYGDGRSSITSSSSDIDIRIAGRIDGGGDMSSTITMVLGSKKYD
jgi:hypothetical protein